MGSDCLSCTLLLLMMRRGLIEKVCLGNQEHLLDSFWQSLKTRIIHYGRIHLLLRLRCGVHFYVSLMARPTFKQPACQPSKHALSPGKGCFPRLIYPPDAQKFHWSAQKAAPVVLMDSKSPSMSNSSTLLQRGHHFKLSAVCA